VQAVSTFESAGGLDNLEALEYCDNDVLRSLTNHILDTFFYKEDDAN